MILICFNLASQVATRRWRDRGTRSSFPVNLSLPLREVLRASRIFYAWKSLTSGLWLNLVKKSARNGYSRFLPLIMCLGLWSGATSAQPTPVVTTLVESGPVVLEVPLTGTVTSARNAALSARVSGLVAAVRVDAGSEVATGDVLLELDPALAKLELARTQAAVAAAEVNLSEARRLLGEAQRLAKTRNIPRTQVEAAEAAVRSATAELERLQAEHSLQAERLARHQLKAPFAGVISNKLTEVGEWVDTGTAVLELVDIHQLRLDIQAPQEYFHRIPPGTPVQVLPDAGPNMPALTGRVSARVPVKNPASRTFLVRIQLPGNGGILTPGMSARALIRIDTGKQAPMVSADALVRAPDGSYRAWVLYPNDGELHARQVRVQTGATVPEGIVVQQGLEAGAEVVIRGNETLRDGQVVRRVESTKR